MPQLRQDPVTGRWVAIATERAKRPSSFTRAPVAVVPATAQCPFCYGHEAMTPPEVVAFRPVETEPNSPGWDIRVVPNLYPAFGPADGTPSVSEHGLYRAMNGAGVHEVIVSSPSHRDDLADLPIATIERVVDSWVERFQAHRVNPIVQYVLLINNHGKEAGASLEHPHSQLFGIPLIPPNAQEELEGIRRYRLEHGRCVYCDIVAREREVGDRVIFENEDFLVYAPYASRTPFEASIVPLRHHARFEDMLPGERRAFAEALSELTSRVTHGLNDPPFNFFLHSAPTQAAPDVDYHWHLELLPKLAVAAGFELGSGVMINVATPEAAAECLRGLSRSRPDGVAATPAVH
jgi:UDPglucose--hexose-1-phosphate uridylyltransferase